jgi:nitroreductase
MLEVMQAIRSRRSIRKFKRQALPQKDVELLMEAARLAPSAANRQPWEMIIVRDENNIRDLVPLCKNQDFIEDCSLFLVGVDDPQQKWSRVDLTIALDHVTLAAEEIGLGTCWIGAFDQERLATFLGIPKGKVITVCLAIGYPDESPGPRSRKSNDVLFHKERFRDR